MGVNQRNSIENIISHWIFILPVDHLSPKITLQPSSFTVGQRQDVICSVSATSDVDLDSINLAWINEENIVTIDERVTIIESMNDLTNFTSNFNASVITTVIQFDPLFEYDEGIYGCYLMVNESVRCQSIQLQNFTS